MTWSWGSLLSKGASLCSHILLTAVPKSCTLKETWDPLDSWICWSFDTLAKGIHPTEDPWGKPLTKGLLAELAGKPLTKGNHRAIIWSIQSDLEFTSNVLKLPHWRHQHPCHECDCQQPVYRHVACPEGKSFKLLTEDLQQFIYVSPSEKEQPPALCNSRCIHLFSEERQLTHFVFHGCRKPLSRQPAFIPLLV